MTGNGEIVTKLICRSGAGTGGRAGPGGPLAHPQYFVDQLTLFELGRTDYPHLSLLAPPMFFTFLQHWGQSEPIPVLKKWASKTVVSNQKNFRKAKKMFGFH